MAKERPCKLCPGKRWGNSSWCYTHHKAREKERREATKAKRLARKQASKTFQLGEKKKWHRKCWKLMSEWVRRSGAGDSEYAECYTCQNVFYWKLLHAGHYQHGKMDFSEDNIKPQCAACNTYHGGRLDSYTMRLISEHGFEWVEDLKRRAAQHPGYRLGELKKIHADLTAKLSTLQ